MSTHHVSRFAAHAFEVGLENALSSNRVETGFQSRAARPRRAQQPLRFVRGKPLVHELGANGEAALQPLCEAPGEAADRVFGTVGVAREPDHQRYRTPFRDQPLERSEARAIIRGRDGRERVGNPGLEIADGDADALGAEIKSQDGARPGVSGER